MNPDTSHRLITNEEIRQKLGGMSNASYYRNVVSRPDFPRPVVLMPGKNLRDEAEIDAFIARLLAERDSHG